MFHFRSKIVKEFRIVSRIGREINSTEVFSLRMTGKFEPDIGEFSRVEVGNMRASECVANIHATSTFGFEIRIEKVGGYREGVAGGRPLHLCFGEKKKIRFD